MTVVHTVENLPYLPPPSIGRYILSDVEARDPTAPTAFVVALDDEGYVWLASSRRRGRGIEFPGGHVEAGETPAQAAVRECREEIGCDIGEPIPIGYIELVSNADPRDVSAKYRARYPFPLSHQQFYAARVLRSHPFVPNAECGPPMRVAPGDILNHPLLQHPGHQAFVVAAFRHWRESPLMTAERRTGPQP